MGSGTQSQLSGRLLPWAEGGTPPYSQNPVPVPVGSGNFTAQPCKTSVN